MIRPVVTLALGALAVAAALSGCSSREGFACINQAQYANAGSIPPLQVPEGLTPPDQTNALRIPPGPEFVPRDRDSEEPCIESPPRFTDLTP